MKREDDQQLWDLLGRGAESPISPFFTRNVLRHIRQQPGFFGKAGSWLNWKITVPASAVALGLLMATLFLHKAPLEPTPRERIAGIDNRSNSELKLENPPPKSDSLPISTGPIDDTRLAGIDDQDYDVVANLDDLQILYETSLWDENSSL